MPMSQVARCEAITKSELHRRFREWLDTTDDSIIGVLPDDERNPQLFVRDGDRLFKIHLDAKRAAISEYLELVDQHGDDIAWTVVMSAKAK